MKPRVDPVPGRDGEERHPAFGMISIHRIHSSPGEVLFQSDVRHPEYVVLRVHEATRKRDLRHDWVHPGKMVTEVSMSLAQFASFVASGGTEGVPCTIDFAAPGTSEPGARPGLNPSSRLSLTTEEVRAAAAEAYKGIQDALSRYEDVLAAKLPAGERRAAMSTLRAAVANAAPNVVHAAHRLNEHAEQVVEQSRADVAAMVVMAAARMGVDASDIREIEEGS